MADAGDTSTATDAKTTDEGAAGAADTTKDTTGKAKPVDDAASSAATGDADDQSGTGEGSDDHTEDGDAGDSASKDDADKSRSDKAKQNQEAGKLRLAKKSSESTSDLRQRLQTEYVDEAENENQREIRQLKTDRYIENIERVGRDLQRDNEQAAREIPLFNPGSPEFNKELLDRSLKRYARDCLTQDENGQVSAYSISLLDYLREEAGMYGAAGGNTSKSQKSQQEDAAAKKAKDDKAKAEMDAAADAAGGASAQAAEAKKTDTDEFDDAFLAGMDDPYARHKPRDAHTFSTAS